MWLWLPVLVELVVDNSTISFGFGFSEGRPLSILVSLVLSESTNIDASILNQSDGLGEGSSISTTPPVLTRCQGKGTSLGKSIVSLGKGVGRGNSLNESRLGKRSRGGRCRGYVGHVSLHVVLLQASSAIIFMAPPSITWLRDWLRDWLRLWLMAPPSIAWLRNWLRDRLWLWLPVLLEDDNSTISFSFGFSEGRPLSILVSLVLGKSTNIDASILNQSDGLREGSSISTTPPVLTGCQGKGTSFGKSIVSLGKGVGRGNSLNESRLSKRSRGGRCRGNVGHVALHMVFSSNSTHKECRNGSVEQFAHDIVWM